MDSSMNTPVVEIKESLSNFKPKDIVKSLNQYIVGQEEAKKLVAIALRNRIRRKFVSSELREEIAPKNILMIGPTGVGKTEIARRIAQTLDVPFIKVEATKFTERGYVGRDVEYMIRAIVNYSVNTVKSRMREQVKNDVYPDVMKVIQKAVYDQLIRNEEKQTIDLPAIEKNKLKNEIKKRLKGGDFDHYLISVKLRKKTLPAFPIVDMFPGMEDMESGFQSLFGEMGIEAEENKRMTVKEAKDALFQQYLDDRIDKDKAVELGIKWAQEMGIVFIDEIDKISDKAKGNGPEVSREGVQRDLLPIVEGTSVNTKYGIVKTDHMLFIAAGAFHVCKPSDMIPELQGRFPIRVELSSLKKEDLLRILVEPKNSLIKQYKALLDTEGLTLEFEKDATERIVEIAFEINSLVEDIGARRLHTVMEYLLEEISFEAPDMKGESFVITKDYVDKRLSTIIKSNDLTKYIL
jgi:ATP-dependent HslUV protease ATP-binding subunit HslU